MIKIYYVALLIIIGLVNCTCASGTGSSKTLAPAQQTQRPNYILTGTLIIPDNRQNEAWILNPTTNEETRYKIGDKLDEWEIIGIFQDKVKLKNGKSEIIYLTIYRPVKEIKQDSQPTETKGLSYRPLIEPLKIGDKLGGEWEVIELSPEGMKLRNGKGEIIHHTMKGIKQDYQPTETERLFYRRVIESLKPKPIQINKMMLDDDRIRWRRKTYRAFPRREHPGEGISRLYKDLASLTKSRTKDYEDSVSHSKQYYQEMIMNLQELIKQCLDSPYYPHYQETIELIRQMQKEDESFYDKYWIGQGASGLLWDVHYLDNPTMSQQSTVPLDEKIPGYIHCIRYSYFYKTNQYKMEFGWGDGMEPFIIPYREPILSAGKLVDVGIPAVPALLNILEDRRPIIAVDDLDKIPARFYRYQDASVEILQRMFIKDKQPFPIQLPEGEYFSEYLFKQTPENKQKILNDIKAWVEKSMNNPTTPQQPPEPPK